jgi:hypothetical protein
MTEAIITSIRLKPELVVVALPARLRLRTIMYPTSNCPPA